MLFSQSKPVDANVPPVKRIDEDNTTDEISKKDTATEQMRNGNEYTELDSHENVDSNLSWIEVAEALDRVYALVLSLFLVIDFTSYGILLLLSGNLF